MKLILFDDSLDASLERELSEKRRALELVIKENENCLSCDAVVRASRELDCVINRINRSQNATQYLS